MDCCGHRYYTRRASSHPPRPRLHTKTQSVAWDPGGPRGGDGSKRHFVVVVVFFFSFSVVFARPQVSTDPGEEGGYVGRGNAEAAEEKVSISINEGGGSSMDDGGGAHVSDRSHRENYANVRPLPGQGHVRISFT